MSQRRFADHARVKRNIDAKKELEERGPTPIPPLPLLVGSPLAGPLTGPQIGPNIPAPSPPPTAGGNNDSGGNGNGGGGGSGGQSGSDGNGGGNSTGEGNGNGGGGNDNEGGGNGNGGGDNGDGGGDNGNGGGDNGNGNGVGGNGGGDNSSGSASGAPSTSNGGTSSPGNGGGGNSGGPTSTSLPVNPSGETDASQSTSDATSDATNTSPGIADAGSSPSSVTPSTNIAVTPIPSNGVPVATFSQSQPSVAASTGNLGAGNNDTGNKTTGAIGQSHNLSAGDIAGIVIALLIVGLAALVVVLRKGAIARRVERREMWFNREAVRTGSYGDNESPRNSGRKIGTAGTRSARSSFATTFDQSQSPHLDMNFDALLPPIPQMAEIRGEGSFVLGLESPLLAFDNSKRNSAGSNSSTASDPNAQFLLLPPIAQGSGVVGTPMSVRPFSPSELYSFPKPPPDTNAERGSVFSYLQSNGLDEHEDNTQTSTGTSPTEPPSGADANPFADPTPAEAAPHSNFAEIEMIRRPFVPKLQDELIVAVGDSVRIVQMFDDGWAMVQKVPPPADKKGKARAVDESDQGLIPIDCLRDVDQALPEFIAQKRVSGYARDLDANAAAVL